MNRPLIILLILLFLGFLLFGAWYISKTFCGVAPVAAATTNNGIWAFDDGKTFNTRSDRYYRFKRNAFNLIPGATSSFNSTIDSTVNYLKTHKDRALTVTGLYSETEKYSGTAGNLGFARANDIKASLVKKGVPAAQIVTESRILREDLFRRDTLDRGAYFTFYPTTGKNNSVARSATSFIAGAPVGSNLVGKDMTIYFALNKGAMRLNTRERQDMQDIKKYLDATPGASLNVSGHTDVRGEADVNKTLSQKRARFAAEQLSKNYKIPLNRMNIVGYGEERPVDNTNTEAGHQKNRRVEIRLVNK